MYAVIFKAEMKATLLDKQSDEYAQYADLAARLRERAQKEYGCLEFTSCTEGNKEIAISYWPDVESIKAWKNDVEHLKAQQLGKENWYQAYKVEITKVIR